jgi:hypothetical protein
MYRFSGFGATSDSDYYMNRGCTPGYPPADELVRLQAIKALQNQYDAAKIACGANNTGPAVGGCLGGIAQKFVPQITAAEAAFAQYCQEKASLATATPPSAPPPPAAAFPPLSPLPAVPVHPFTVQGGICAGGKVLPSNQAQMADRINELYAKLSSVPQDCAMAYGPRIAQAKSAGNLSAYAAADAARLKCATDAMNELIMQLNKAVETLNATCVSPAPKAIPKTIMPSKVVPPASTTTTIPKTIMPSLTLPPAVPKTVVTPPPTYTPPTPSYSTAPEVTEQPVFTSAPSLETGEQYLKQPTLEEGEDVGTKKKASLVVGGILLLLLAGGGYAVYRATRKGK